MGKKDIKYDQHNYRDHDERNLSLIKKSIQRCGAGRSILLDKNGEIIAGNATYKTLQELGIPVKIIPTDGKTAIALQRTDLDTNSRSEEHPTMKPVKLLALQIRNSSRMGEIVLDPFGGSGSTLIACEQLGRKARLVELDPKYCDVILNRWEKLTGGTATLCK